MKRQCHGEKQETAVNGKGVILFSCFLVVLNLLDSVMETDILVYTHVAVVTLYTLQQLSSPVSTVNSSALAPFSDSDLEQTSAAAEAEASGPRRCLLVSVSIINV